MAERVATGGRNLRRFVLFATDVLVARAVERQFIFVRALCLLVVRPLVQNLT